MSIRALTFVVQIVEQANSGLDRLKSSVTFMSPVNFMSHMKVFVSFRNAMKVFNHNFALPLLSTNLELHGQISKINQ
jgi:hypothetical protein